MAPHAATATPDPTTAALLILILAAVTVCYLGLCWLYPFTNCRRCTGTGKRRAPLGRTFRLCRRCHGDGRQLRPGRLLLNYLRELHDDGTKR